MKMNLTVLVAAAFIPVVVGFIWYHKSVFGKSWMRLNNFREEDLQHRRLLSFLIPALILSLMLALALAPIVIHQFALAGLVGGAPVSEPDRRWLAAAMKAYGHSYRTFRHGAYHGAMSALFFTLPLIGVVALMERKSWKYILIHWGYWLVCLTLMGGVLCKWL